MLLDLMLFICTRVMMIKVTFDKLAIHPAVLNRVERNHGRIIAVEAEGPYMIVIIDFYRGIDQVQLIKFLELEAEEISLDSVVVL